MKLKTITHEFVEKNEYTPKGARYLIVGTFPSVLIKKKFGRLQAGDTMFFYGGRANAFWKIIDRVYGLDLSGCDKGKRLEKINRFLDKKRIALTDIIYKCRSCGGAGDDAPGRDAIRGVVLLVGGGLCLGGVIFVG